MSKWTLDDGKVITLLTPEEYKSLSNGTKLTSIFGESAIKSSTSNLHGDVNYIDQDTRAGYLSWGIHAS